MRQFQAPGSGMGFSNVPWDTALGQQSLLGQGPGSPLRSLGLLLPQNSRLVCQGLQLALPTFVITWGEVNQSRMATAGHCGMSKRAGRLLRRAQCVSQRVAGGNTVHPLSRSRKKTTGWFYWAQHCSQIWLPQPT